MDRDGEMFEILRVGQDRIAWAVLKAAFTGIAVIVPLALIAPENDDLTTILFYLPVFLILGFIALVLRAGKTHLAGWLLALSFCLFSTGAVVVMGGVTANASGSYIACIMIAAAVVGSRSAAFLTVVSVSAICALAIFEIFGAMPAPLAPKNSLTNALTATLLPIVFAVYLLNQMVSLRRDALDAAAERARERDKAEADLLQAQKMDVVGRLSSGVAHDFNNLLTVIRSSVDVMRLDGNEDELLDDIEQSARRATMLTRRLLAFARPHDLEPVDLDIGEALDDFRPLLETIAGDEIRLHVDCASNILVRLDPLSFQQILLNLVINGRQAQDGKGTIWIEIDHLEDQVELRVRDDGPGIPAELRHKVFEPFFTTKPAGTGLGLSTISNLVDASNGTIELKNGSPGSTFVITWPRLKTLQHPRSERPITLELKGLPSILIVDDNIAVRRAMASLLRSRGSEVREAADGLEALALLESYEPDIVITDNSMPGMTGLELSDRIRECDPELPILVVSGNPLDRDLQAQMLFLPKPFGEEALVDAIAKLYEQ